MSKRTGLLGLAGAAMIQLALILSPAVAVSSGAPITETAHQQAVDARLQPAAIAGWAWQDAANREGFDALD